MTRCVCFVGCGGLVMRCACGREGEERQRHRRRSVPHDTGQQGSARAVPRPRLWGSGQCLLYCCCCCCRPRPVYLEVAVQHAVAVHEVEAAQQLEQEHLVVVGGQVVVGANHCVQVGLEIGVVAEAVVVTVVVTQVAVVVTGAGRRFGLGGGGERFGQVVVVVAAVAVTMTAAAALERRQAAATAGEVVGRCRRGGG